MKYKGEIIAIIVIAIFVGLFIYANGVIQQKGEEEAWGGSDDQASQVIESTGYQPWITPLWEPPSGEIESLFFSLQAALGAIVIGYFFGYWRGLQKVNKQ
jgi:cobalt/nickel transport protein